MMRRGKWSDISDLAPSLDRVLMFRSKKTMTDLGLGYLFPLVTEDRIELCYRIIDVHMPFACSIIYWLYCWDHIKNLDWSYIRSTWLILLLNDVMKLDNSKCQDVYKTTFVVIVKDWRKFYNWRKWLMDWVGWTIVGKVLISPWLWDSIHTG